MTKIKFQDLLTIVDKFLSLRIKTCMHAKPQAHHQNYRPIKVTLITRALKIINADLSAFTPVRACVWQISQAMTLRHDFHSITLPPTCFHMKERCERDKNRRKEKNKKNIWETLKMQINQQKTNIHCAKMSPTLRTCCWCHL